MEVIAIMPHLWIVPVVALAVAALGFLWWFGFSNWFPGEFVRRYPDERMRWDGWRHSAIAWWSIAGLVGVLWAVLLIPYESKYHVFYKLEGSVESVTNTFESGSGELSTTPVIQLSGYDDPILVSSSRILTLEGKDVTLTCSLSWEPYGLDVTMCGVAAIHP